MILYHIDCVGALRVVICTTITPTTTLVKTRTCTEENVVLPTGNTKHLFMKCHWISTDLSPFVHKGSVMVCSKTKKNEFINQKRRNTN